jgi:hypothetical protein
MRACQAQVDRSLAGLFRKIVNQLEITMHNPALPADAHFFSHHPRSSIKKDQFITGSRLAGYMEDDLLLDIIKQSLRLKHITINGYQPYYTTPQCLEASRTTPAIKN